MTKRINWDNALNHGSGGPCPWDIDEELFVCSMCDREQDASEYDAIVSRDEGEDICWTCARKMEEEQ